MAFTDDAALVIWFCSGAAALVTEAVIGASCELADWLEAVSANLAESEASLLDLLLVGGDLTVTLLNAAVNLPDLYSLRLNPLYSAGEYASLRVISMDIITGIGTIPVSCDVGI